MSDKVDDSDGSPEDYITDNMDVIPGEVWLKVISVMQKQEKIALWTGVEGK